MTNANSPTKAGLQDLIADRDRDLQRRDLQHNPPWIESRDEPPWRHIRERERAIVRVTNRLEKAKRMLDHDFDMSS